MSMFGLIFVVLAVLLFVWQQRTNPTASLLAKLVVSIVVSFVATIIAIVVFKLIAWLFWWIVIIGGAIAVYLAFMSKKKTPAA